VHIDFWHAVRHSSRGIPTADLVYEVAVLKKYPDVLHTDLFNVCSFGRNSLSDMSKK
jgi:hypothetical protein